MENVACLLGFSGDDPNFLYWTGWVRDHLGKSAPQIYLCGILNLNTAKRNLLHDRNVVPIDLSSLFPPANFPDSVIRHRYATEWFLLSLYEGRPRELLRWPRGSRPMAVLPKGMPEIIRPGDDQLQQERLSPDEQPQTATGDQTG